MPKKAVRISDDTEALEYTRRLYQNVFEWYNIADQKAQVIITLAGVIVGLWSGFLFFGGDSSLKTIIESFGFETILFLGLFITAISGSIYSSLQCLWSRHAPNSVMGSILLKKNAQIESQPPESKGDKPSGISTNQKENKGKYSAERMWFFHKVRDLDEVEFCRQLQGVDSTFEIAILANEIHILSNNVTKKHNWVNAGFLLLALSLLLFLLTGVDVILRMKLL